MKGGTSDRAAGFWKRHLDKVGVGGSLFAALCCLGFPALVSILSAIGLGFLINDDILRPLLILFLLVAILGPLFAGKLPHLADEFDGSLLLASFLLVLSACTLIRGGPAPLAKYRRELRSETNEHEPHHSSLLSP